MLQPDLTISIVSADNLNLLLPCLRSIYETTQNNNLEIWVVDNASTDGTAAAVRAAFPEVKVIRNAARQGFSTNNNLVLGQGLGRYLLLLNDDTLVKDGALERMIEFMDAHPEAGAMSCAQTNPDGSWQHAFGHFPHPFIEGLWPSANWSHLSTREREEPFEVDWVCGAAMLVRREVMEQVGILDTAFDPIYSEEVDWCYRIKRADWKIFLLPQVQIIHYGGQTMNRAMPKKYELLLSHKALFFRKHRGNAAARLYKVILGFSTTGKVLYWTARGLVQRRDSASKKKRDLHWYILKRIPAL
ncbi:MAG: glycosyltransferase family 2 protein [Anaerolineae bacterium]|nr:glycosyltransferase family 2 protein [Anaerolineae bacterium]